MELYTVSLAVFFISIAFYIAGSVTELARVLTVVAAVVCAFCLLFPAIH